MKTTKRTRRGFIHALLIVLCVLVALAAVLPLIMGAAYLIVNRSNGSLVSSEETREYLLYVPASYDPANPVPLVVTIHGFAEWPAHVSETSRWNKLADEQGFIVVYPSGTRFPKRWVTYIPTDPANGRTKDVIFISDLIDQLEVEYNIDPARIYINGFSNGGGMAYLLGCQLADRIAAIGAVSGAYLYPFESCQPSRPVPMITFHGTADPIVPFYGGPSRSFDVPFSTIPNWVSSRALLNGCDPSPLVFDAADGVITSRYSDCIQGADVIFYRINGQGHDWPGGKALPVWIAGAHSDAVNATALMWEFFQTHPLQSASE